MMLSMGTSTYADPAIAGQPAFALVSFVPAGFNHSMSASLQELSADIATRGDPRAAEVADACQRLCNQTLFAVCKVRAVAESAGAAAEIAKDIVRNTDSSLPVYTVRVGHPFPITTKPGMAAEVDRVSVQKEMDETMADAAQKAAVQQEREKREVLQRETSFKEQLASEADAPEETPGTMEHYMCMRYKYASLRRAEDELLERADDIHKKHARVRDDIVALGDTPHKRNYMQVFREKLGHAIDSDPLFVYLGIDI